MKRVLPSPVATVRTRVDITGVVQGVGFRPAVARIADARGVTGFVYNDSGSVHCEFEGADVDVDGAVEDIRRAPPPMARIDSIVRTVLAPTGAGDFRIIDSTPAGSAAPSCPPRYRQLRRLSARDARPPHRPALPAPVHHLHQLRPALHRHHRPALRPARHHDGAVRDVRPVCR